MTVEPLDIIRVTAKATLIATEDAQNVYYFQHGGDAPLEDPPVVAALASQINLAHDQVNGEQSTQLEYTTINLYNVTQRLLLDEVPWPGITSGTLGGDALPYQVAGLVTFPTALAKTLGKKFLAGFTEAGNGAQGTPAAEIITALGNYVVELLDLVVIGGHDFPIGHIRTDPLTFIAWATGLVESLWATQRRRKIGVGS